MLKLLTSFCLTDLRYADAYNGLAEGYVEIEEKELAIKNFKKSVELNPNNTYASERIKKLEATTNQ